MTIFENELRDLVFLCEKLEDVLRGRERLVLAAAWGRAAQFCEEDYAELLGRVDIEAMTGDFENVFADAIHFSANRSERPPNAVVSMRTPAFPCDRARAREADRFRRRRLRLRLYRLPREGGDECMNRSGSGGQRGRRRLAVACSDVGERLRGVSGVERVGEQHGVVYWAMQSDALLAKHMQRQLQVVRVLGDGCVFKESAEFGCEREAERASWIGGDAEGEAGLFFGGLGHVEQRQRRGLLVVRFRLGGRRSIERKGEAVCAGGSIECGGLFGAGSSINSTGSALRRSKFAQHGGEFELGEKIAAGFEVGRLRLHSGKVERERDVGVDGDEFFGEQDRVAVLLEGLSVGFALDLGGAVENGFDAAEFLNQFDAAFVADAGRAGNVVDGIAAQGHDVDDFLRRDAEYLGHFGGIEDQVVLLRVEDLHLRRDELHHVLVAGDDEDLMRCSAASRARVPMTSSASKPSASRMGMRKASRARRM